MLMSAGTHRGQRHWNHGAGTIGGYEPSGIVPRTKLESSVRVPLTEPSLQSLAAQFTNTLKSRLYTSKVSCIICKLL